MLAVKRHGSFWPGFDRGGGRGMLVAFRPSWTASTIRRTTAFVSASDSFSKRVHAGGGCRLPLREGCTRPVPRWAPRRGKWKKQKPTPATAVGAWALQTDTRPARHRDKQRLAWLCADLIECIETQLEIVDPQQRTVAISSCISRFVYGEARGALLALGCKAPPIELFTVNRDGGDGEGLVGDASFWWKQHRECQTADVTRVSDPSGNHGDFIHFGFDYEERPLPVNITDAASVIIKTLAQWMRWCNSPDESDFSWQSLQVIGPGSPPGGQSAPSFNKVRPKVSSGLTVAKLVARPGHAATSSSGDPADDHHADGETRSKRIITATVAAQRYHVDAETIGRHVRSETLTDYRPSGHARNAALLVDENEVARRWPHRVPTK